MRLRLKIILLFLVIASAARILVVLNSHCIAKDGTVFINMAREFSQGRWPDVEKFRQQPLFPMLLAAWQTLFGDSIFTAQMFEVLVSALCVVPLYLLCEDCFGRRCAAMTALLAALHPRLAAYPADVVSEPLYILCYTTAIWLGHRAFTRGRLGYFIAAGACSGLAYLTRPEGLGAALIICAWGILLLIKGRKLPRRRTLAGICCTVIFLVAVGGPYVMLLKQKTGEFRLTMKKKASELLIPTQNVSRLPTSERGWKPLGEAVEYYTYRLYETGREYVEEFHLVFAIALLALSWRRKVPRGRFDEFYLVSVVVFNVSICYLLNVVHSYLTARHLVMAVNFSLIAAGVGLVEIFSWARLPGRKRKLLAAAAVLLAALTAAPLLKEHGANRVGIPETGLWIRDTYGPGLSICGFFLPRVALYAQGHYTELQSYCFGRHNKRYPRVYQSVIDYIHEVDGDIFIYNTKNIGRAITEFDFPAAIKDTDLKFVRAFPYGRGPKRHYIRVYEVVKPGNERKQPH